MSATVSQTQSVGFCAPNSSRISTSASKTGARICSSVVATSGVIRLLNALEQFPVIAEESRTPFSKIKAWTIPTARWVLPTPTVSRKQKPTPFGSHGVPGDETGAPSCRPPPATGLPGRSRVQRYPGCSARIAWESQPVSAAGPLAAASGIRTAGHSALHQVEQSNAGRSLHKWGKIQSWDYAQLTSSAQPSPAQRKVEEVERKRQMT